MANLYKKITVKTDPKTGQRKTIESKKWYARYVDTNGVDRRIALSGDKKISQRMLDEMLLAIDQGRNNDPVIEAAKRPMTEHLENFKKSLAAKNNTPNYVDQTHKRVLFYAETMKIRNIGGITPESIESFVALLREKRGISLQTCNHYIRVIKTFCGWLLKNNRIARHPILSVSRFHIETDKRHARRALEMDEFQRLVSAAEAGHEIQGMSGPDRAMLYILASWTGFRKGELGSITARSFKLDAQYPCLTIEASYSKRRREDVQYLHPDVVAKVREWLNERKFGPNEILFPVSARTCGLERTTAKMMKNDLKAARQKWIDEAETPEEKAKREESDFLKYIDSKGLFADFHTLRHTFITNLCRSNISPKTAQTLARHSDISLTMNIYSHVSPEEQAAAINAMPGFNKPK